MEKIIELILKVDTEISIASKAFADETKKIEEKLSGNVSVLAALKKEIDRIHQELEAKIHPLDNHIGNLEGKIVSKNNELETLSKILSDKKTSLDKEFATKGQLCDELDVKITKLQNLYDSLAEFKKELSANISKDSITLNKVQTDLKQLNNEVKVITDKKKILESEFGDLTNIKDSLNVELRNKRAEVESLEKRLKAKK